MFDRRHIINFDIFLFFVTLLITFLGFLNLKSICSSSSTTFSFYYYKQAYWILIGFVILCFLLNISYQTLLRYAYYLHFISLLLLVFVLFFGKTKFGSQRWLYLGFFSLQPSELTKITFILCLSKFFSENASQTPYKIKDFLFPFLFLLITFLPVYFQPDLGTAGIILLVFLSMAFFLNISKKTIFSFISFVFLCLPFLWFFLKEYQKRRILVFLNPELDPFNAGYQVIQSKIAVGSGGFLGKGFKLGTQSQLRFLPEQHTDFVFSVWSEEWGFVGCTILLLLYFFIIYRSLSIAHRSKNLAASFVSLGVCSLFFWHFIINVSMTLGLFPVVGVTLPLFSYGGSSLVTFMIAISLLININMRKFN